MDKKIAGVIAPGKTYVVRFKPKSGTVWSSSYEFTAPRPTSESLAAAVNTTSGANVTRNRVYCEVRRNANVTVSTSNTAITFDTVISNDYDMWQASTPNLILCPLDGWYQAMATYCWDKDSTVNYCQLIHQVNVRHFDPSMPVTQNMAYTTMDLIYPGDRYPHETLTTIPVYCIAGDYWTMTAASGSYGSDPPALFGGAADRQNFSVMYLGP